MIATHQLSTLTLDALAAQIEDGWSPNMRGPADLPDRHRTLARTVADTVSLLEPVDAAFTRSLRFSTASSNLEHCQRFSPIR
ncbi:hypothetical protein [Rhodococcus sp. NPDC057529]|uniref:hypothetical protein n=1 Tax=Rhodococcus sp. NPDC057529 TaxID=3346158 RepID=UPI0036706EBA